jgi:hypothetical protein
MNNIDEILAEYFTWKGEAIHVINQTENYKRLKAKLLAGRERAVREATIDTIKQMYPYLKPESAKYADVWLEQLTPTLELTKKGTK